MPVGRLGFIVSSIGLRRTGCGYPAACYSNPFWVDHTQTCQVRPSPASESRKQSWAAPDRFTNHLGLLYVRYPRPRPVALGGVVFFMMKGVCVRALISVSDKRDLGAFAIGLRAVDVEIFSTGNTARCLTDAGIAVRPVSDLTG